MRHATAVRRLTAIAQRCQQVRSLWEVEDGLVAVYAFGGVLEPAEATGGSLEVVQVAFVVNAGPDVVAWGARPPRFAGLPYVLDLEKAPVDWYFRPAALPVSNHLIVRPLLIWSREHGVQQESLTAVAAGTAEALRPKAPRDGVLSRQLVEELAASRAYLERVRDRYWQRGWRSEHHAGGSYPEHHLWDATHGYLDLLAAVERL